MKTATIALVAAPLAYLALVGYLAAKVRPIPITFLNNARAFEAEPLEQRAA